MAGVHGTGHRPGCVSLVPLMSRPLLASPLCSSQGIKAWRALGSRLLLQQDLGH